MIGRGRDVDRKGWTLIGRVGRDVVEGRVGSGRWIQTVLMEGLDVDWKGWIWTLLTEGLEGTLDPDVVEERIGSRRSCRKDWIKTLLMEGTLDPDGDRKGWKRRSEETISDGLDVDWKRG